MRSQYFDNLVQKHAAQKALLQRVKANHKSRQEERALSKQRRAEREETRREWIAAARAAALQGAAAR